MASATVYELIEAAKHVFAEKGAAASLEQVARQAEVSIASLYRPFRRATP